MPSSRRPRAELTLPDEHDNEETVNAKPKSASPVASKPRAVSKTATPRARAAAKPAASKTAAAKPSPARPVAPKAPAKRGAQPKPNAAQPKPKAAAPKPAVQPKPAVPAVKRAAQRKPRTAAALPRPKAAAPKAAAQRKPRKAAARPAGRPEPKVAATATRGAPRAATKPAPPTRIQLAQAPRSAPEPAPADGFRPDLEGLRGIAVLLVLLFHAGVPGIPGGYIGVDVFFVLSGFLITGLLVRELERTGTVSLSGFYARRVRRLLPAAALCLFVTVAVSALVLPPLRVPDVSADGVAAALYVSNLRFAFEATDYLRAEVAPSPLLHYWSLGVEEQFYLIWPALLLLVTRRGGAVVRRVAIAAAVVGAISLVLSLWLTTANAPWAFYSLPTRAWELGIGALLAVGAARLARIPPRTSRIALWAGLGLILLSAVAIGTSTPFPGVAALLPTLGAGLVILAGSSAYLGTTRSPLDRRPLRFLGRISYSLYLWHWPLLVLPAAALGMALPLPATLALAALAIPIAAASQRWVEEPIRHGRVVGLVPRRSLAAAGALTLVLVVASTSFGGAAEERLVAAASTGVVASSEVDDFIESQQAPPAAPIWDNIPTPRPTVQATPSPERFDGPVPANLAPSLVDAKQDRPLIYDDGCHVNSSAQTPGECVFGDHDASTTVVLMGDSHAAQWFPAFDALGRERHWRLVSLTKSGCPPAEVTIWVGTFERAYTECDEWREAVFARIADMHPDLVVVSMTYGQTPIVDGKTLDGEPAREVMIDAYKRTLDRLDSIASRVALLADTPRAPDDPPICLSSHLDDALSCATARQDAVEGDWLEEQQGVAAAEGAAFVDPTPWVCPVDPCPAVIGRYLVYRDTHHLTTTYAMALRNRLAAALPVPAAQQHLGGG